MSRRYLILLFVWAACIGMPFARQSKITIPAKPTPANDGKQMYVSYCASCHGLDGRGQGPTAGALKTTPPDLTLLSKNNKGVFPAEHVIATLKFGVQDAAHGSKEMPVWGPALKTVESPLGGTQQMQALRITNLTSYLQTIQTK